MIKKLFKKILKNHLFIGILRRRSVKNGVLKSTIWGGGIFCEDINKAISLFVPFEKQSDAVYLDHVKKDIIDCNLLYGATPEEFFLFGFDKVRSHKYRKSFLMNQHKDELILKYTSLDCYQQDLRDKYHFYELTKSYFRRKVIKVETTADKTAFLDFCLTNKSFIVKPISGMCGRKTDVYNCLNLTQANQIFQKLLDSSETYVVEELIKQVDDFAEFNKSSVNTIRIPSFRTKGGFKILQPFLRTGRAGKVVDNGGAGGIFCVIDEHSGVVITDGFDELGGQYKIHPDSHKSFMGWKIPRWQELIELVCEIHQSLPSKHRYIGFDFALTEEGWVLIEGNWGQFIGQYCTHQGIRKKFTELMSQTI